jgi:REP element-mobilizing transposase RayT
VRRCFLLGNDPVSGKNYDHRKVWIDEQLAHQARFFGVDLLCQAILSNHLHLILRSRPDVVKQWDDAEVARRWLMLCPERRDERRQPLEPTEFEINRIRLDKQKVAAIRSRLSDISWWMRLLSQNIAQRANREDKEVGKFWQARYRAVRLLDETAILACAAYVDLNPIRAAMSTTIEESDFTSAQKRAQDLQARCGMKARRRKSAGRQSTRAESQSQESADSSSRSARHLAPVDLKERSGKTGPDANKQGVRCSNKGFLPMSTADYLSLLDWTARQYRSDKPGRTPQQIAPLFERLGITADSWRELVRNFGRLFSVVAGKPQVIDSHSSRSGSGHRYHTKPAVRGLLAPA